MAGASSYNRVHPYPFGFEAYIHIIMPAIAESSEVGGAKKRDVEKSMVFTMKIEGVHGAGVTFGGRSSKAIWCLQILSKAIWGLQIWS